MVQLVFRVNAWDVMWLQVYITNGSESPDPNGNPSVAT